MSGDITRQIETLTGGQHPPIFEFLPTYRRGTFAGIGDPPARRAPFRVLFAGRIERNKGVFDLLEITRRLRAAGRGDIEFDLCGTGTMLAELKRQVSAAGLEDRFRVHGHCQQPRMREMFSGSHVVIVPTTTEFGEGFNQVVAEGVLAGRPVITSSVCPAIEYVREAVVEVPPDDVAAYHQAIEQLAADQGLYEAKRQACFALQEQFYDPSRGWAAALKKALAVIDRR